MLLDTCSLGFKRQDLKKKMGWRSCQAQKGRRCFENEDGRAARWGTVGGATGLTTIVLKPREPGFRGPPQPNLPTAA